MQNVSHSEGQLETHSSMERKGELLSRLCEWEFRVSEPAEVDPETYDRAAEAFVNATLDHPEVVAVYGDSATPTVPGISDLDLAVVVEDRVERLGELQARVDAVLEEYADVILDRPVLAPASAFESFPLLANTTTSLDYLGGRRFEPVEPDEVALSLRLFDHLVIEPYCYVDLHLVPEVDARGLRSAVPLAVERALWPVVAAATDSNPASGGRLHLNKQRGLGNARNVRHDRDLYVRAFGSPPPLEERVLDRVEAGREEYFEDPLTDEAYLDLLLDTFAYRHRFLGEFVARQTVYPDADRTSHLRRSEPTFATPAWHTLTPYSTVTLFYQSGIRGRILPPAAALHVAALPGSDDLFYGSPPDPEFGDDAVPRTVERRNEAIHQCLAFADAHEGWRNTFKPTAVVRFIENATSAPPASVPWASRIKERVRAVRNVAVTRLWNRTLTDRPAPGRQPPPVRSRDDPGGRS